MAHAPLVQNHVPRAYHPILSGDIELTEKRPHRGLKRHTRSGWISLSPARAASHLPRKPRARAALAKLNSPFPGKGFRNILLSTSGLKSRETARPMISNSGGGIGLEACPFEKKPIAQSQYGWF
ncbi:MAG: hypothetical protein COV67_00200 [Nitrospinae bacterium CG11_big_fil_rev_8_21_14_0_20_56_8]|nr:MAG: hypothetical protein COV67_00200 [Nitrospinae bacterium CG11_big_fil_rev_8_21_14_0_20_56_8]